MKIIYFILNILYISFFSYQSFCYQRLVILDISISNSSNLIGSFLWMIPSFVLIYASKSINEKKSLTLTFALPLFGVTVFHGLWFSMFLNDGASFVFSSIILGAVGVLFDYGSQKNHLCEHNL